MRRLGYLLEHYGPGDVATLESLRGLLAWFLTSLAGHPLREVLTSNKELSACCGNLSEHRGELLAAVDFLFTVV